MTHPSLHEDLYNAVDKENKELKELVRTLLEEMRFNAGLTNMWFAIHSDKVEEKRELITKVYYRAGESDESKTT